MLLLSAMDSVRRFFSDYIKRFSTLAGPVITCGPVLNWFDLDNRGHRLLVSEDCAINTPAVAAAYAVTRYAKQAQMKLVLSNFCSVAFLINMVCTSDSHSLQINPVGDMISVIDMPPPDESIWWRGKKGFEVGFFPCECVEVIRDKVPSGKESLDAISLRHLLNTSQEIPKVLFHCAEFIESKGIIDGIYRLSGIASNIQNLELPNPICTYHLYEKFVEAAKSSENQRLILLRDVVQQLPPPNYRTLEYLSRHLYRVSLRGNETGMTAKNVAIVWAPNLLRSKSLEVGGVAALQGVGIQAVVTEYLIRYCELIFIHPVVVNSLKKRPKKSRPKSLAISTPTKLLSLEEARSRALTAASGSYVPQEQRYIEVGGGPSNLPPTYHTAGKLYLRLEKSNISPITKISDSEHLTNNDESESSTTTTDEDHQKVTATTSLDTSSCAMNFNATLRPVKSAESLIPQSERSFKDLSSSSSSPNSGEVKDEVASLETVTRAILKTTASRDSPKTHSRSSSHDSYFERTPLSSLSFKSSKPINSDSESPVDPKSSSLDLSEIQVNFELEENEMKIFSEDEDALMSTSFTSIDDDDDEARPSFRRISRHNSRKSDQLRIPIFKGPKEQGAPSSPVLNNNNNNNSVLNSEVSPKKKKSDFTPGTSPNANLVKRSKMETETEEIMNPSLAMSPSIKFIDDRPASAIEDQESLSDCLEHTSNEEKEEIIQCETMDRLSFVFSNENDFVSNVSLNEDNLDKLVIAEIHNDPQTKNNASVAGDNEETDQEEPSISTVKELSLEVFSPDETDNTKDESSDNPIKDDQIIVESNLEDDGHSIIENSIENSSISSPIETSYSIAGATVSENESFSLTSFEDDFKPNGEEEVEQGERQDKEDTIPKLYSTSPTQVTEFKKEDPLSPPKFTSEEIIIRPFTHESVVAMEIDEDSNITFIKDPSSSTDQQHPSVLMEIEENSIKELMTAVPVHVLEDGCDEEDDEEEEEEQLGHFDYQPIQTSSCSSDSYSLLLEDIKSSGGLSTSYKKKGTQQMSSQGIPELEAKLNESNLFKASRAVCKSEDFPKKLSKRNTETQILSPGDGGDEVPLVRRNSIHNVPYVDVNDPGTRERMERYKEERRSLFRAKYKVEDYRVGSSSGVTAVDIKQMQICESTIKDKKPPLERISTQIQNHFYSCSATTATTTTNVLEHNYKNSNHTKVNDNNNLLLNNEYNTKLTKPTLSLQRKNNSPSSSSSSFGLINEDVNVKERAAIFGKKSRSNEEKASRSGNHCLFLPPIVIYAC
ncbi:ARHGAP32 [Lepeophtheirus salmonis]|uniref:ARHGAP32 n=1 Tax=Lepeophtheirus salmonis TaxID=72036 RepID=A0A7R8D9I8_LEPSM|nr:ARHGAP32 [Lepeophtheirus salmonis]CAF3018340.1 ARHGAP32 [Lepeophtheirus salmonis]